MMRKKNVMLAKISAVTLSALITISFMPILGGSVSYAEEAGDQVQEELVTQEAPELEEEELEPGVVEVPDGEAPDVFEEEAAPEVKEETAPAQPAALPEEGEGDGEGEGEGEGEEEEGPLVIAPGEQKLCDITYDNEVVYQFTAPKSATYFFYSSSSPNSPSSIDPKVTVEVLTSNGGSSVVDSDDDDGDQNHFRVEFSAQAGKTYLFKIRVYGENSEGEFYINLVEDVFSASIKVTLNKKTGIATVKGTAVGDTFRYLYVDGYTADVDIYGDSSFTVKVDMKDYDIGYHEIYATLYDRDVEVYNKKAVPTYIYKKPSNSTSYYETGYKKIAFTYGGDSYKNCNLVVQYKKSGSKKWKKGKTVKPGNTVTIKKLGAKKKYSVRTYFFATTYYKGKKYTFTGKSRPSKAVTVKTGGGKLKVKKVTVTKAKVETRTDVSYEWRSQWLGTMLYMYRVAVPYNYQVTTVTVTVKLKKKPGAAGVSLNGIKVKGNKKTYKTQMTFYGSLIGKKVKIKIQSYQSSKYGGYSKSVTKSAKVKK